MPSPLSKELDGVIHRIFDHRVFINGEIVNFLYNFETKRKDIEVETLFKATESVGELKYELSELLLATKHLQDIKVNLNNLLIKVEDFPIECPQIITSNGILTESRRHREIKKIEFDKDLQHKYSRVEYSFEEKEEEISELYSDLQIKLNIPK